MLCRAPTARSSGGCAAVRSPGSRGSKELGARVPEPRGDGQCPPLGTGGDEGPAASRPHPRPGRQAPGAGRDGEGAAWSAVRGLGGPPLRPGSPGPEEGPAPPPPPSAPPRSRSRSRARRRRRRRRRRSHCRFSATHRRDARAGQLRRAPARAEPSATPRHPCCSPAPGPHSPTRALSASAGLSEALRSRAADVQAPAGSSPGRAAHSTGPRAFRCGGA
ncbi:serine/arginine repetitive matrix protein 3-like [Cricetulus griseus]|uniref:Serine/arginine repetitive matrix protein 3-like n=1 Tax=Cricetulus griseus TaxID=10029 RepID=A0A9J7FYV0_CRIGR|nr:serine/arginine repetitive matrix protein 3-like [Cricetulus griseus]